MSPPETIDHNIRADAHVLRYRTLSIHVEDELDKTGGKGKKSKKEDPAVAIRNIDAHLVPSEELYTRYSTSAGHGLDSAAVQRRSQLGKNVISPPPTHYWKKAANYIFGGFNFLMWIAFIVTIVCRLLPCNCS